MSLISTPSVIDPRPSASVHLSVVITCYNLGAYLGEALKSIPEREDVEVVIVDDGSTEALTREVLDELDVKRYTIIRQVNMGLAKARNNGIAQARGGIILVLDADNRINPVFIERSLAILGADPEVGVVYGDATYFGERSGPWVVGPYDFPRLLQGNYIDACACFRRSVWAQVGGYDEHMPHMGIEDWDFWLRCSVAGVGFHYVPEVFFDYRVRQGSMLSGTYANRHALTDYVLSKPALRHLRSLRELLRTPPVARVQVMGGREMLGELVRRMKGKLLRPFSGRGSTGHDGGMS